MIEANKDMVIFVSGKTCRKFRVSKRDHRHIIVDFREWIGLTEYVKKDVDGPGFVTERIHTVNGVDAK